MTDQPAETTDETPDTPTEDTGSDEAGPDAHIPNVTAEARSGFGGPMPGGTYDPANAASGAPTDEPLEGVYDTDMASVVQRDEFTNPVGEETVANTAAPGQDGGDTQAAAPDSANEPPEGTVSDIVSWVGSDPARAQAALDAENTKEQPRSTLVAALQPIAAG